MARRVNSNILYSCTCGRDGECRAVIYKKASNTCCRELLFEFIKPQLKHALIHSHYAEYTVDGIGAQLLVMFHENHLFFFTSNSCVIKYFVIDFANVKMINLVYLYITITLHINEYLSNIFAGLMCIIICHLN